jgi:predicted DNA binding protein
MGKINWPKSQKTMKQDKLKNSLIEQLKEMPILQFACKKVGVSRASYYRWRKDLEFAKEADAAIVEGETLITDLGESQLISLIRDRNFPAIQLWLKTHHPKYANKVEVEGHLTYSDEELTPEQASIVKEALRLASFDKNYERDKEK